MIKAQSLINRYFDAAWKQGRKGIGYSDTQLPEHKELILYVFDLEHRLAVAEELKADFKKAMKLFEDTGLDNLLWTLLDTITKGE